LSRTLKRARLENRIAVITGSGAGMGEGIARLFASEQGSVVVSDRDEPNGAAVAASIRNEGGQAIFQRTDVTVEVECRELIARAVGTYGRIDVLVNNAAINTRGNIENTTAEMWDHSFATNVRGAFICIREAVTHMKQLRSGSIINIGSVNAYIGEPNLMAYSASKGALTTLTKNTASFLNNYRIRVNQINPGWTLTPNEHRVQIEEGRGEDWVSEAIRTRPFGRLLFPRDVALAALYFASDESQCITGSVLDLEQCPVGAPQSWWMKVGPHS
jgi:NAD(P)-dependent dehydrogenase (short-subunit alcohol dehydrogenase family)